MRCSKGFRVSSFNGHFFIRSMDLLALPATNADHAYAVQLAHDETLPTATESYLQCALLLAPTRTANDDSRAHDVRPVVSDVAQMYRAVDGDAMSAARAGAGRTRFEPPLRLQDACRRCTKLSAALKEFRLPTSAARAFNRLIRPEKMRLVPLFLLCAGKSAALRGHPRRPGG